MPKKAGEANQPDESQRTPGFILQKTLSLLSKPLWW
jgi:hypothetical protein